MRKPSTAVQVPPSPKETNKGSWVAVARLSLKKEEDNRRNQKHGKRKEGGSYLEKTSFRMEKKEN